MNELCLVKHDKPCHRYKDTNCVVMESISAGTLCLNNVFIEKFRNLYSFNEGS